VKLIWMRTKAILNWLREPKHFWIMALPVVGALMFSIRPGVTEAEILYAGLVLQVFGIGSVWWGIRETRKLFGHGGIGEWTREWLKRFPLRTKMVSVGMAGETNIAFDLRARLKGTAGTGANPTVEQRLDAAEQNIKLLDARIDQAEAEMDKKFGEHDDRLRREEAARIKVDQEIRELVTTTGTGGLHISAMGAVWLLVGVTLSTAAPQLARWLGAGG
jgi:hypothetical protein